jgi:hypothetical protein
VPAVGVTSFSLFPGLAIVSPDSGRLVLNRTGKYISWSCTHMCAMYAHRRVPASTKRDRAARLPARILPFPFPKFSTPSSSAGSSAQAASCFTHSTYLSIQP